MRFFHRQVCRIIILCFIFLSTKHLYIEITCAKICTTLCGVYMYLSVLCCTNWICACFFGFFNEKQNRANTRRDPGVRVTHKQRCVLERITWSEEMHLSARNRERSGRIVKGITRRKVCDVLWNPININFSCNNALSNLVFFPRFLISGLKTSWT